MTEPGWLLLNRVLLLSSVITIDTPVHVYYKTLLKVTHHIMAFFHQLTVIKYFITTPSVSKSKRYNERLWEHVFCEIYRKPIARTPCQPTLPVNPQLSGVQAGVWDPFEPQPQAHRGVNLPIVLEYPLVSPVRQVAQKALNGSTPGDHQGAPT